MVVAQADPIGDELFNRLLASVKELPSVKDHWSADGKRLGKYAIDKFLGAGEFAEVFSCTARKTTRPTKDGDDEGVTRQQLAVKHVKKAKLNVRSDVRRTLRRTRQLGQELAAMKRVGAECEFVCALVDVLHTKHHVHLIMEVRARLRAIRYHRAPLSILQQTRWLLGFTSRVCDRSYANTAQRGGGDLYDYIASRSREGEEEEDDVEGDGEGREYTGGGVPPCAARQILHALSCAVAHCHSVGVAHRDIKSENLLLRTGGGGDPDAVHDVRLCDFGLSAIASDRASSTAAAVRSSPSPTTVEQFAEEGGAPTARTPSTPPAAVAPAPHRRAAISSPPSPPPATTTATGGDGVARRRWLFSEFVGSPGFVAPEILFESEYDGRPSDIWSVGCIALELHKHAPLPADRAAPSFEKEWVGCVYSPNAMADRARFERAHECALRPLRDRRAPPVDGKAAASSASAEPPGVLRIEAAAESVAADDDDATCLVAFAVQLLAITPSDRPRSDAVPRLPWLAGAARATIQAAGTTMQITPLATPPPRLPSSGATAEVAPPQDDARVSQIVVVAAPPCGADDDGNASTLRTMPNDDGDGGGRRRSGRSPRSVPGSPVRPRVKKLASIDKQPSGGGEAVKSGSGGGFFSYPTSADVSKAVAPVPMLARPDAGHRHAETSDKVPKPSLITGTGAI